MIARLLDGGPAVIATGGGAFMREETRNRIRDKAVSIWLKADADIIMKRVKRRADRPLLQTADPAATVEPPARSARAGLPERRPDDRLARRAARPHRRRMYRCPARPALCRRPAAQPTTDGIERHAMTAPLKHSADITVDVALGDRAYDIVIGRGVLPSLGARIAALRPGVRTAIVTDRTVAKHWLEPAERSLAEAGIPPSRIIVEEGEGSKTYAGLEKVSEALIAAKIERNDLVIALGGGVVGDLAGFAAAILRRGVDFVQVPTSLLAQVDSSVGGKTGINSPQGKNLLGAFHQPVLVIADTAVLDTLSPRQFRAGYAEVAKYGVLGDEAFFALAGSQPCRHLLGRRGARARDRHLLPRQGRDRLARRAREPASARCSISATPSAMRWRRRPAFPIACSMAKAFPSAWCWRRNFPRSSA